MSAMVGRLLSGVGAGGVTLVAAVQPGLLVPVALVLAVLGGLPLLLIATMALVAVCSRVPSRQAAAERILDRLLSVLRPRDASTPPAPRRKKADRNHHPRTG